MATKPMKSKPVKSSLPRTKTAAIEPQQAFVDPLADVPLHRPVTDRFVIQPGEIELITVGSIEIVTHPSSEEDKTEPTTPPAGRRGQRPRDAT